MKPGSLFARKDRLRLLRAVAPRPLDLANPLPWTEISADRQRTAKTVENTPHTRTSFLISEPPFPSLARIGDRTDEASYVRVVTAHVPHRHRVPLAILHLDLAGIGKPVISSMGRASMSARSITIGPSPLRSRPTTPVFPTPVVTSNPAARSRSATKPAVRVSCMDSSGCACTSL